MNLRRKEKLLEKYLLEKKENHYRLAYSYLRNKEDSLDVIQESIYKAFKKIEQLKDVKIINSWFYKILTNTCLDLIKKNKKTLLLGEEFLEEKMPSVYDKYEEVDLTRALDNLPIETNTIIKLKVFEDFSFDEIGLITQRNVNTVKSQFYRGLKQLKGSLKNYGGDFDE